jgi:hypothetical protein
MRKVGSKFGTALMLSAMFFLSWGLLACTTQEQHVIERIYCANYVTNHASTECVGGKILRIPIAYFEHVPNQADGETMYLVVDYPSMLPWTIVKRTSSDTSEVNKLTIDIRGIDRRTPIKIAEIYIKTVAPIPQPHPIFGLKVFEDEVLGEPRRKTTRWQALVPDENNPEVFIGCPHNTALEQNHLLGCQAWTFTAWNLGINYRYKRANLEHWREINTEIINLIASFTTDK